MKETQENELQEMKDIDLRWVVSTLLKKKKLIVWGVFLTTLVAGFIAFMLPKRYQSDGFFQMGIAPIDKEGTVLGLPIPLYKSSSNFFFDPGHFINMARQDDRQSESELRKLETVSRNPVFSRLR